MGDFDSEKVSKREAKDKKKKEQGYHQFEDDCASIDSISMQRQQQHSGGAGQAAAAAASTPSAAATVSASAAASTSPKAKKAKSFKLPTKKNLLKKSSADKEENKPKNKRKKNQKDEVQQQEPNRPVFGVPLAVAVQRSKSHDGVPLPACFRECIDFVEANALNCEGIYRVSGVKSKVQALMRAYNFHLSVELSDYDPFVVASVLKNFIRELPQNLLTDRLLPEFEKSWSIKDKQQRIDTFRGLLSSLPTTNYMLLAYTLLHMSHVIERQKVNRMTMQNISIVLSPTMQISHKVLQVFFTNLSDLFPNVSIKRYVPPMRPQARMEIPETLADVEEELVKQESLLEWLHQELSALQSDGLDSEDKSNLVWEVQRVVTALKRKKSLIELDDVEAIEAELVKQESTLNRLHATLTGCPTDDQEAQDQLWEVQRTITMLKRKLRKAGQRSAGNNNPNAIRYSTSADHVISGASDLAKSPSFPTNTGIRPDMSALEENLGLNLALRKVTEDSTATTTAASNAAPPATAAASAAPPASAAASAPAPAPAPVAATEAVAAKEQVGQSADAANQPNSTQQLDQQQQQQQPLEVAEHPLPTDAAVLDRADSLRDSSRYCGSSINEDTDVELYALTKNPPPPEFQQDTEEEEEEEEDDDYEEGEDKYGDEDTSAQGDIADADDYGQDLDKLAYRLEEEENQLLCASEVEEETADLLAMSEDLRRLRYEEEELKLLSTELSLRVARERQEMERLRGEIHRSRHQRSDPDSSSASSSDSEEETDEALVEQARFFKEDNQRLVKENADLAERLQKERMFCAEYKVQLRMQLDAATARNQQLICID